MPADSANFVSELNELWPLAGPTGIGDPVSAANGQIIAIKLSLVNSFPNINGAVTVLPAELNHLGELSADFQSQLDTISASAFGIATDTSASMATMSAEYSDSLDTMSASLSVMVQTMSASFDTQIETLSANLNASKYNVGATVEDAKSWGESHQFFQTATPAGAVEGDLWFQLEGT